MATEGQYFTDDAKEIMENKRRKELAEKFLKENSLDFRTLKPDMLRSMGMPINNVENIMRVIANKLTELYGIKKWELRNDKQIKFFGVTDEHLQIMKTYINIDKYIQDFARRINGECKDEIGGNSSMTPAEVRQDYSQNIIEVPDEIVDNQLRGMYTKTISHLESEISICTDDELKEKYTKSLEMYKKKLLDLNHKDEAG